MSLQGYRAAIEYARSYGLSVFPCVERGKEPLTPHGCKDATRNTEQISMWWHRWPRANVGIACGAISDGLLVLDVDGDDGQESLRKLERTHGAINTAQVLTGKGSHYWFRSERSFKNRVRLLPGLDVRTDGGYVIAPPSIHPSGREYSWEVSSMLDEVGVQAVPAWLVQLISQDDKKAQVKPGSHWRSLVANGVAEGGRNQATAQIAGHLLRHYVDGYVALELIQAWNQCRNQPPLDPSEVERIVESIAAAEIRRRMGVTHV